MTNYIDINGIDFELKKSKYADKCIKKHLEQPIKTLYDCYSKPSKEKEKLYKDIINWFSGCKKIVHPSVTSFNTYKFTVQAVLLNDDFKPYGLIVITRNHNRVYIQA